MVTNKEVIEKFWKEFDAYTLGKYVTFKHSYGKYVEASVIRTCYDLFENKDGGAKGWKYTIP